MFDIIYKVKKSLIFKICICLFVMVYMFNGMFFEYEKKVEAFAFAPALLALSPEIITSIATVLVGAGVIMNDDHAMESAVNNFYYNARDTADQVGNLITTAVDGVINIGTGLWNDVKSYVQSKYSVGENVVPVQPVLENGYNIMGSTFETTTSKYEIVQYDADTWQYTKYNKTMGTTEVLNYVDSLTVPYFMLKKVSEITTYPWNAYVVHVRPSDGKELFTQYGLGAFSDAQLLLQDATVSGSDVLSDPDYDFGYNDSVSGETVRQVQVPASVSDLIGKSYSDVQISSPPVSTPAPVPSIGLPNSWVGSWDWNISGQTKTSGDVGSIAVGMSGTWSGTWAYRTTALGTQELVWTGTYIGVDGLTWSGDITSTGTPSSVGTGGLDFTLPSGVSLDFTPLMLTGEVFKSKFPFSIPWDIYNSINALNVGANAPRFTIGFKGVSTDIDFSIFEQWAVIVRWGVMIMFNIGLIILTRRVIGG